MMDASLDSVLQGCLTALENDEPIEPIIDRWPRHRAVLQSLLATARQIQALDQRPSAAAQQRDLNAFLAQARALRRPDSTPRQASLRAWLRPVVALTTVLAALVVVSVSAVRASEAALPGDPLYGLKRFYEDVQLALTIDEASRTQLDHELSQRRRDEVRALQTADRKVVVEFEGTIEAMHAQSWVVDQIEVVIDSQTALTGAAPQLGARARVVGRLSGDEALLATHIHVLQPAPPPAVTPTLTLAPPPTATSLPSTPAPEESPPPEPTATPRPQPTHEPDPTDTPKPRDIEFSGRVEAMNDDVWLIAGKAVIVDAETDIDDAIVVGAQVKVKAKQLADGTLRARRIDLRETKPQPTKTPPGETPPPEQTPPPQPTQVEKIKFKGVVTRMEGDRWTIGDKIIRVDGDTEIHGDISIGSKVKGQAIRQPDGLWLATRIERAD